MYLPILNLSIIIVRQLSSFVVVVVDRRCTAGGRCLTWYEAITNVAHQESANSHRNWNKPKIRAKTDTAAAATQPKPSKVVGWLPNCRCTLLSIGGRIKGEKNRRRSSAQCSFAVGPVRQTKSPLNAAAGWWERGTKILDSWNLPILIGQEQGEGW